VASQAPAGDVEAVAGLMERALTDDELRRELVAAGDRAVSRHTWASVAARTQTAYGQLAERCDERMRPLRRATVQRFRVAAVGPFPPAASGVAYYNARVFTELAARCDVDCFSENDGAPADRIAGARTFPIDAFGRAFSPAGYDAVVYVLGNSRFHIRTLELARRYPGVCWLHDASLAGVYLTTAGLYLPGVPPERIDFDAAREFMRARLHDCMGPQAPDLGERWWQPEAYVEAGALMTEILLRQARRVVVSTDAAVALVKPRAPAGLPVDVVPLAVCDPHVARTATPHDEPWIVSLGIVSEVKQVELLVEAVASVRETRPVRLALVGNVDPDYAQQLAARAATLGLGDALEVTGFVTDGAYWSWAARATLIVQLRSRSVGEGSAAVADAIALGTPVLTNVGAAHELPSGVVELLPADATAADVAAAIVTLLDDDRRRHALETAAAAYARANHFGAVAERVLALLRDTAERRFPEPLLLEPLASGVPA
jgi:glycosyltransferase involved in cell wall biosynthesis